MHKYWRIALTSWQRAMVYRLNTLLEIFGYFSTMLIAIALWRFVFQKVGAASIGGYTSTQMISYLLVAGYLASAFWFTAQGNRVMNDIKDGVLSNYLVKPMHILGYYLAYGLTGKSSQIFFSTLTFAILLIALNLSGVVLQISLHPLTVLAFILAFILAMLMQYFIFYNTALSAF